jgi:hypothetical protein
MPADLSNVLIHQIATSSVGPPLDDDDRRTRFEVFNRWNILAGVQLVNGVSDPVEQIQLHATGGTKPGSFGKLLAALVAEHGGHDTPPLDPWGAKA